jgi:hypothetical protein
LTSKPSKISTTQESISINWNEPVDNGGCSIQGYSVHIDDGDSGEFIEANAENDNYVRLLPSLSTLEIRRIEALNLGKTYRILVKAYNYAGVAESPILGVVFASLPSQPPVPTKIEDESDSKQITIDISDFPEESNGGCPILSFDI